MTAITTHQEKPSQVMREGLPASHRSNESQLYLEKSKQLATLGGIILIASLLVLSIAASKYNLIPGFDLNQPEMQTKFVLAYGAASILAETAKSKLRNERASLFKVARNGFLSALGIYLIISA